MSRGPQGLKPLFFSAGYGTAKAVPLPKPFHAVPIPEPVDAVSTPQLTQGVASSKFFAPFLQTLLRLLFMFSLLAGISFAQNSAPTIYAESYRKGTTLITEDRFELKLTTTNPDYKQRVRDSGGVERYELMVTPKIGEGEGKNKITSWTVGIYDLRHTVYGNLLQFDQESSEEPRDNLYWLNPAHSAPVPILARRIIKVEGFYVAFQVKSFHYNPPDSAYVDSMTVEWEFSNRDPRAAAENK